MAASLRRLQRRPSTDLSEDRVLHWNSGLMMAANGIGTGNRKAVGNQFPSRRPRAKPRQVERAGKGNRVPTVGFGLLRSQERLVAAVTANAARRDRARSRSRPTASAKERAQS